MAQDWKNTGEFCSQLLTDCSKTVRLTGETSDKEKTRLLHILKVIHFMDSFLIAIKFCKASAERTIKTHKQQFDRKIVEMKLNDVIHTTCMAYYEILDFNGYKCPQVFYFHNSTHVRSHPKLPKSSMIGWERLSIWP